MGVRKEEKNEKEEQKEEEKGEEEVMVVDVMGIRAWESIREDFLISCVCVRDDAEWKR